MTQSRTIESMITAETVLAWSWTMLYEIVWESTHDSLQDHWNLWLLLRWTMVDAGTLAPKCPHNPRSTPAQPHWEVSCRIGNFGVLHQPFFRTPWRTGSTAGRGGTTWRTGAEEVLTLSWTMLFETVCKSTHDRLQNHQNLWLWLRPCLHSWPIPHRNLW